MVWCRAAPKLPFLAWVTAALSLGSGRLIGPEGRGVEGGAKSASGWGVRAALSPQSQKALGGSGPGGKAAAGLPGPRTLAFFFGF